MQLWGTFKINNLINYSVTSHSENVPSLGRQKTYCFLQHCLLDCLWIYNSLCHTPRFVFFVGSFQSTGCRWTRYETSLFGFNSYHNNPWSLTDLKTVNWGTSIGIFYFNMEQNSSQWVLFPSNSLTRAPLPWLNVVPQYVGSLWWEGRLLGLPVWLCAVCGAENLLSFRAKSMLVTEAQVKYKWFAYTGYTWNHNKSF